MRAGETKHRWVCILGNKSRLPRSPALNSRHLQTQRQATSFSPNAGSVFLSPEGGPVTASLSLKRERASRRVGSSAWVPAGPGQGPVPHICIQHVFTFRASPGEHKSYTVCKCGGIVVASSSFRGSVGKASEIGLSKQGEEMFLHRTYYRAARAPLGAA